VTDIDKNLGELYRDVDIFMKTLKRSGGNPNDPNEAARIRRAQNTHTELKPLVITIGEMGYNVGHRGSKEDIQAVAAEIPDWEKQLEKADFEDAKGRLNKLKELLAQAQD
jgi:hypothetical protein